MYKSIIQFDNLTKNLLLLILLYFICKTFSILLIYNTFEWLFSTPTFFFGDQKTYLNCGPTTPNVLYSLSLCFLSIDSLKDAQAIAIGLFLNTSKDILYIMIVHYCTNRRISMIFAVVLSLHPFLALYHPRYVTTIFASISLLLIFAYDTKSSWLKTTFFSNKFIVTIIAILVGFRYANIIPFLLFFIFKKYKDFYLMIFLIASSIILVWFGWTYINLFLEITIYGQEYILSFNNIFSWVKVTNVAFIDYLLALCLYLSSHLIALTGFRETAVLYFSDYFFPVGFMSISEFILFISFSVFHIFGIVAFVIYFWHQRAIVFCVLVNIFMCCLFLTHIRYFIHLIPLALLGLSIFIDKKILK